MSDAQFSRNRGLIRQAEQARLGESRIAIAGLGGVGGRLATRLAAMGVKSFALADPDVFDISNLNRQEGANHHTIGKLKVEVISGMVRDIQPDACVEVWREGVTDTNRRDFVRGATVVVDAVDFQSPWVGLGLAQATRAIGAPLVMGVEVGFGAYTTWFPARSRRGSYESFLGVEFGLDHHLLESGAASVAFRRWVPHIPAYAALDAFSAIVDGELEAPAIAPAVDICSSQLATLIFELILGNPGQQPAPVLKVIDVRERRVRTIRWHTIHHYLSLTRVVLANRLGRVSPALSCETVAEGKLNAS